MSTYLFDIKREDARRALEALYLAETVDPHMVLGELKTLHFDLEEYIRSIEDEISRGNGRAEGTGSAPTGRVIAGSATREDERTRP